MFFEGEDQPSRRDPHVGRAVRRGLGRRVWMALLALLALLSTAGCGGGEQGATAAEQDSPDAAAGSEPRGEDGDDPPPGESDPGAVGPGCETPVGDVADGLSEERTLISGGAERRYRIHVPPTLGADPVPLVIDLHGYLSGSELQATMSGFEELADEEGFVVATPQGSGELPYWNAVPHPELPDDVVFVEDVIDEISEQVCVDPARVHVTGFSNGAFLTSLVACELSDRVASAAPVAGLLTPAGCEPERAVPILTIHGTDDQFVSFTGPPNPALETLTWNDESRSAFDGLPFADVRTSAGAWAEMDGCDATPTVQQVSPAVEETTYGSCDDGATVILLAVTGAGHTWPGSAFSVASAPILGSTTDEFIATTTIWEFFEAHPM